MSRHATAYVRGLEIADETARTVFLLLAERTTAQGDRRRPEEMPEIMGLELQDADIRALAVQTGLTPEDFRQQLREARRSLKDDWLVGHPVGDKAGQKVRKSDGIDRLGRGVQFVQRPPAPGADVVGLRSASRVDVGRRQAGKEVLLDLADQPPTDVVLPAALRERGAQFDVRGDAEFFVQFPSSGA